MEAKETAGLPMTERVARDCSSGLLETTSNRLWSAAKTNTHQLLQKKKEGREEERKGGANGKKEGLVTKYKCMLEDQRKRKIKSQGALWLTDREWEKKDKINGETGVAVCLQDTKPFIHSFILRYSTSIFSGNCN